MSLNEKAKSQAQRGLIFGKRNQYKTKAKTPEKWQWIWDEEWENKGKLPKKVKNETVQNVVFNESNTRARFVNEEDIYGDPYVSDTTGPTKPVTPNIPGMKDPAVVRAGDKTLDYNDEEGEVVDIFMYDNDPDMFEEIVTQDWGADVEDFERDTYLVYVKSPTNGPFGDQGAVWYVYGRDGAYVPE